MRIRRNDSSPEQYHRNTYLEADLIVFKLKKKNRRLILVYNQFIESCNTT